jgi:hypothetical protein
MHCLNCGYNLRALEHDSCPECGRGFSPEEPDTYGAANTHRLLRWAKVAGWVAAMIAAGVGMASAIAMTTGKHDVIAFIFYWVLALLPLVIACMAYISCRSACKRWPSKRAFTVAAVLIIFNASLLIQWPSQASFLLYRNALNRHAHDAINTPQKHTQPTRIGIFPILQTGTNTVQGKGQVTLKINGGQGPDYLVYGMTDAEIESNFNIWSYKRLDKDWHIVHED